MIPPSLVLPSSQQELDRFRELVLEDSSLQELLREPEDAVKFCALVLRLGQERGFEFTESDVAGAMQAGRQVWVEQRQIQ